jgi:hypothetical protein
MKQEEEQVEDTAADRLFVMTQKQKKQLVKKQKQFYQSQE